MKTRRTFLKGLLGITGSIVGLALVKIGKASPAKAKNTDFEDWTCITRLNQHQHPLRGKIQNIDFENKTITVYVDSLIAAEKAGRVQKPFGNKPSWSISK